jgi:hypothetical protein
MDAIDQPTVLASWIRLLLVTEGNLLLWPFGQAGLLNSVECCVICMSVREPIRQGRMKMVFDSSAGSRGGPAEEPHYDDSDGFPSLHQPHL